LTEQEDEINDGDVLGGFNVKLGDDRVMDDK